MVHASGWALNVNRSHHLPSDESRPWARPRPEVEAARCTADRAHDIRYEADDIIAAARAAGVESLLAEADALDDEVRRSVAPGVDIEDVLTSEY